jgi:hypothetical protein
VYIPIFTTQYHIATHHHTNTQEGKSDKGLTSPPIRSPSANFKYLIPAQKRLAFTAWVNNRPELKRAMADIVANPEQSLKIDVTIGGDQDFAKVLQHRIGRYEVECVCL